MREEWRVVVGPWRLRRPAADDLEGGAGGIGALGSVTLALSRSVVSTLAWSLAIGVWWGLFEASLGLATRYFRHAGFDPISGWNLYVSGVVYYAIFGLLFGVLAAPIVALFAVRTPSGRRSTLPLLVSMLLGSAVGILLISVVRERFLWRVERDHPVALLVNLAAVLIWIGVGIAVYRAIDRLPGRLRRRLGRDLPWRRVACAVGIGLPALLTAIGLARAALGSSAVPEATMSARRPAVAASAEERPNIVLVALETTRADRVDPASPRGRERAPNLAALADRGTTFQNARATSSWTRPSMASLFTSLYPLQHGMTLKNASLGDDVTTLPAVLREHGYLTSALIANSLAGSPSYQFDETVKVRSEAAGKVGFLDPRPFFAESLSIFAARGLRLLILGPRSLSTYVDAFDLNEEVERWLASSPSSPFFLHVHYLDPHDPYYRHPSGWLQFNPRTRHGLRRVLAAYDAEIRHVDAAVGDLIEKLERHGLADDTVIVVLSDHGEEFLEHGEWGHGRNLHQETLSVPLILAGPGIPVDATVESSVSLVDVAPTLLKLVGIEVPESFEGRDLLAPSGEATSLVLAELDGLGGVEQSLERDGWKLIRSPGSQRPARLFDLSVDPGELRDLAGARPELRAELEAELERALAELPRYEPPSESELDADDLSQLHALGYLN